MSINETLTGVIGVINSPFLNDDTIDEISLGRYVQHAIISGAKGLLTLGMASEVNKLTLEEKDIIVRTVVREAKGRVSVICGVSASSQQERLHLAEKFGGFGCDGIMLNIPFESEKTFIRQVSEIAELQPGFLMIQDWSFNGFGIPIEVIVKLHKEITCFSSYKVEVVPAGIKYTKALMATNGQLHVSGGWASSQMIEALDRGVHAFMSTILPDVYHRIFQLYRAGKRDSAKALFYELVPILAFSHQHLDISIHFNKRLVWKQGLFSTTNVRQPILPFDKYHEKVADELIDKALSLCQRLKSEYVAEAEV